MGRTNRISDRLKSAVIGIPLAIASISPADGLAASSLMAHLHRHTAALPLACQKMRGGTYSHPLRHCTGRGERIRTSDHLNPIQVRYLAALATETVWQYTQEVGFWQMTYTCRVIMCVV